MSMLALWMRHLVRILRGGFQARFSRGATILAFYPEVSVFRTSRPGLHQNSYSFG
jgi:hypothetical protein